MSTYGSRDKNLFRSNDPSLKNNKYYPLVDSETGEIIIKKSDGRSSLLGGSVAGDKTVGIIPRGGVFNATTNDQKEIEFFSRPDVQKDVRDKAILTVEKGIYDATKNDPNPPSYQQRNAAATNLIKPPQQGPTPDGTTLDEAQKKAAKPQETTSFDIKDIQGVSDRSSYGPYVYPQSLDLSTQDVIKFTMIKPVASKFNTEFGAKTLSSKYSIDNNLGYVILPVQPSISDSNTVRWSGLTLNAFEAYGAGQAINLANSSSLPELFAKVGTGIQDIAGKFLQSTELQQAAQIGLAQEAMGLQGLLSRATGAILNPNLELLFEGPELRSFGFTFKMSPRNKDDARQVRSIIRFFKQGMSVKTTSSSVFLKSPHVFKIQYQTPRREDHPSINRIKICALVSCDVDYTPDGTYMTFNDDEGKYPMTSYGMSLRFSEIEPIYDQDYKGLPEDEIGY